MQPVWKAVYLYSTFDTSHASQPWSMRSNNYANIATICKHLTCKQAAQINCYILINCNPAAAAVAFCSRTLTAFMTVNTITHGSAECMQLQGTHACFTVSECAGSEIIMKSEFGVWDWKWLDERGEKRSEKKYQIIHINYQFRCL